MAIEGDSPVHENLVVVLSLRQVGRDTCYLDSVIKRSLSPGFAGIDNPLFYMDNTLMFFADAKRGISDIVNSMKEL